MDLKISISRKAWNVFVNSLWVIAFAAGFALNLCDAMHGWAQHQYEWFCFSAVAAACFSLLRCLSCLWCCLSHLDQ